MATSNVSGRNFVMGTLLLFLDFTATPSFINKLNDYPVQLKFQVMVMTAQKAQELANSANDFIGFVLQNQNPDGNPRHDYELITFTYFQPTHVGSNPDRTTILQKAPTSWRRDQRETMIPGNTKLANLTLSKVKLQSTIPTNQAELDVFAYLVFMPIEGNSRENPNRGSEENYVCYEIYPARANGDIIGDIQHAVTKKRTSVYAAIVHPSPPAGFD